MISQQRYKYSQCVSEHENPWNHRYIKFQGRTHKGMCCFPCNKHYQLNFAHHVTTGVHDSQHPSRFAISDHVLMWALKSTTTLPFVLQRSHFFFSKKGKIWGCEPITNTKKIIIIKREREIYHVHVKVIRQIISHRNKSIIPKLILLSTSFTTTRFWSRNTHESRIILWMRSSCRIN